MSVPTFSVVVVSRGSALRLRWLLNALDELRFERTCWEVVVVHDGAARTATILRSHPLADALRPVVFQGSAIAAEAQGWRAARGSWIAFVDEDWRPPEGWLTAVHEVVRDHPKKAIAGPLQSDPDEAAMLHAAYWSGPGSEPRSTRCNMVVPRAALEQPGGSRLTNEPIVPDARIAAYGTVRDESLLRRLRGTIALSDLPEQFAADPTRRRELELGAFWRRTHAVLPLALAGALLQHRRPLALGLAIPWVLLREPRHSGPRGKMRHLLELPGWGVIETAELLSLARGSIRHHTLVL